MIWKCWYIQRNFKVSLSFKNLFSNVPVLLNKYLHIFVFPLSWELYLSSDFFFFFSHRQGIFKYAWFLKKWVGIILEINIVYNNNLNIFIWVFLSLVPIFVSELVWQMIYHRKNIKFFLDCVQNYFHHSDSVEVK